MILASLFPVFSLLAAGWLLKRYSITNRQFLAVSDRLVYYIFFPAMLFWKIGGSSSKGIDTGLLVSGLIAVLVIYLLSLLIIKIGSIKRFSAGAFSQSCYRFNTYIGMAVVMNALGDEGIRYFGILISFVIPVINLLAVSTLIWFSGENLNVREKFRYTLKAVAGNPLILACIFGIIFSRTVNYFPLFINNTLKLSSSVTLPLALISIGSSLSLKGIRKHGLLSFAATVVKLIVFPVTGYSLMRYFGVPDLPFKTGMIFFALPASTAIYILSSQLNSDTEYASSAVMLSTLLSFISLSVILLIL